MEPTHDTTWERAVAQLAQRFEYPPTPDIASAIWARTPAHGPESTTGRGHPSPAGRRLAWAVVIIALLAGGLLAVPRTRAALLSLVARIGAIDIFIDETAPTLSPPPTDAAGSLAPPATAAPPATLPATTPGAIDHSLALFELGNPVTLEEARRLADFDLVAPAAPGAPDEVYVHRNVDLPAVTLVWRDSAGAPLSLTEIGADEFAMKLVAEEDVTSLVVGGRPAMWLEGPHHLQLLGRWLESPLLIESNVLIWTSGEVTYRLEGNMTLEAAREIAESMLPDPAAPVK